MFRFACSVVLQGGRGAADRYPCVWGALTVFWPHWVCPRSRLCAFPVYTAQVPGCSMWSRPCAACGSSFRVLHKSTDSAGPAFCAFPHRSSSGSQELDEHTLPGGSVPYPLHGPSLNFQGVQVRCALCLFWEADFWLRPSWQMSTIQNLRESLVRDWKPACSLVGNTVSGAECAPFPSPHLLPLAGHGPVRSRLALLWYSLSPLSRELAGSA